MQCLRPMSPVTLLMRRNPTACTSHPLGLLQERKPVTSLSPKVVPEQELHLFWSYQRLMLRSIGKEPFGGWNLNFRFLNQKLQRRKYEQIGAEKKEE